MSQIRFLPKNKAAHFQDEESILQVAFKNDVEINHSCGGMGSCGTCRVWVDGDPSRLPPRNEVEQEMADARSFGDHERLACQLSPIDGLCVRIPNGYKTD